MKLWPRKKQAPRQRGRIGLVDGEWEGGGLIGRGTKGVAQITVEELEVCHGLSRVRFVSASGIPRSLVYQLRDLIPEWVATNKVAWLDSCATDRNTTEPGGSNLTETNAAGLRGGKSSA